MQSTALTTFLQDSKNSNLNIQSAVCGQLNNILFDSSLVINGRRPSFMGIEKSNGTMVVISNWLSHPNLSPTDGWCLVRDKIRLKDRQTPPFDVFSAGADRGERCCNPWLNILKLWGQGTGGLSALFADFQFESPYRSLHVVLLQTDSPSNCQLRRTKEVRSAGKDKRYRP